MAANTIHVRIKCGYCKQEAKADIPLCNCDQRMIAEIQIDHVDGAGRRTVLIGRAPKKKRKKKGARS